MGERESSVIGGMPWDWDLEAGCLTHFGIPAIAMWVDPSLAQLLEPLRKEVGDDLFRLLVAHSGSQGASLDYDRIVSELGDSFEQGFDRWGTAVSSAGWGHFSLREYDAETCTAVVRVDNPWELRLRPPEEGLGCPFLQGKVIGIFSEAFKVRCWAEERVTIGTGAAYIEFQVAASDKTVDIELNRLRESRAHAKERALSAEIERGTAELLAVQAKQKAILSSLSDLVVTIDPDGNIEEYLPPNDDASSFPSAKHAIGQPVTAIFGEVFSDIVRRAMHSEKTPFAITFDINHEGNKVYYDARVSLRFDAEQSFSGLTLVIRDETEQYRLKTELAHRRELEVVGQLAGGIAHDFNNILTAISGAAELLKLQASNETRSLVDTVFDASASAASLIQGMLSFSPGGAGATVVVELHDVIDTTVQLLRRTIDRRIRCYTDLSADLHRVRGDASRLQSTFLNLGINARDALSKGGEIHFTTRNVRIDPGAKGFSESLQPGDYVEVRVHDNGEGMAPSTVAQVLEPFFTTKGDGRGTGLGLTGAARTVSDHGGAIDVQSTLGEGSIISIYLPVCTEAGPAAKIERPVMKRLPVTTPRGCALLVDDNQMLRDIGRRILEELGYDVLLAPDGSTALYCYRREHRRLDLVLLDLDMPVMSGTDALPAMRKIDPNVPILMTSGFSGETMTPAGADGFIKKPYLMQDLAEAIDAVLR